MAGRIPKWDDLGLPSLNQLGNRLGYSRNGGSVLGFLGDEYLDDCFLDLMDTVMWRACCNSETDEVSLDTVVKIIYNKFQDEGERERRIRMSLLNSGSKKQGPRATVQEQNIDSDYSVWEVFQFMEIKDICEALIKPAEMHCSVTKNTEADSMLQYVFRDVRKNHRRGLKPMLPRYYKLQKVDKHSDMIKKLDPNNWFIYKEAPWKEDTLDFIQLIPSTKLVKFMYSIRNPDLMSTIAGFWWSDRKQKGLYKTEVGKQIIEQHGCLARYLIRTFENEEEGDKELARKVYKDKLLKGFFDAVFVQLCKGPVSSMAVCWLCLNYPSFIDFDLLRAMYHSGDCKDWFVLNEEDQCIQQHIGNHNKWDDSTASEDSEYEAEKASFQPVYSRDLSARVYDHDYSGDINNFDRILKSEELNIGATEEIKTNAIEGWIQQARWNSSSVSKTSYRDQQINSETIVEDNESCTSSLNKKKSNQKPERMQQTEMKACYRNDSDLSQDLSGVHIQSRQSSFKPIREITPNSRPTFLSSTDERSDFGESSVQRAVGNVPEVILNRPPITTKKPAGGYFNAPRSAQPQTQPETLFTSQSERSDFGESSLQETASNSYSQEHVRSRQYSQRSRTRGRSFTARGSYLKSSNVRSENEIPTQYHSSSPRECESFEQSALSDFGNSSAGTQNQENVPTYLHKMGPQNFQNPMPRQTGESSFYNSGTSRAMGRRGRGSSIFATGVSSRGRGRAQRTQTSITAASLALNSTLHRR